MTDELIEYASLLDDIKVRIRRAQTRAVFSANLEMLALYWEIGAIIVTRQQTEGWGAGVLRRLALDLKSELSGVKGFSERNLKRMTQFHRAYPNLFEIGPPAVAQLNDSEFHPQKGPPAVAQLDGAGTEALSGELRQLVSRLPWAHNMLLIQKVKDLATRRWYLQQSLAQGWSRNVLDLMINSGAHQRQGKSTSNFTARLPAPQSDLVQQALKDPHIFDFLTLDSPFRGQNEFLPQRRRRCATP